MSLFSKLKDYNLELDKILDNKTFSSNIKNLLLSMIYKVEVSYKDYKEVKRCVREKEEVLNEIIETVRLYCDNIKVVEPDSSQAKMLIENNLEALTNEFERSILAYPTEMALLYAISEISPKYYYINEEVIIGRLIQNVLVDGYNINTTEILRDFNGWSWDTSVDEKYNFINNLIYQNLLMILGDKFLTEWRTYNSTDRDCLIEAKKFIKYFTNNDKYIKSLYKLIYMSSEGEEKEKIEKKLNSYNKTLQKMEDKLKFIDEQKERKIKLTKKLEKIDYALHDKKILEKNFNKSNEKLSKEKKIKSIAKYRNMLKKERENILKEINDISYILKPSNFISRRQVLQETVQVCSGEKKLEKIIILSQKEFLNFIDKKLNKMKTRDELIDLIYELRYYQKLRITNSVCIEDIEEIETYVDKVMKKAITKLCEIGAMKIISMDIELNFEIIKYALDTKIINIEQIKLEFDIDDKGLIIRVYDKDNFEKQGRKQIKATKKTLEVAKKRKIKLFS